MKVARCRARLLCAVAAAVVTGGLAGACDYPFQPFVANAQGPFSIFGYLDFKADTQWVRVMPIRQSILPEPGPIDAVVTLEEAGSGRTVTLRDSLFRFTDPALGGEAYVHNFWTTEPVRAGATYHLTARRSDGAATTAEVAMPPDLRLTFKNTGLDYARLAVRAGRILGVHVLYTMARDNGEPAPALVLPQLPEIDSGDPTLHDLLVDGSDLLPPPQGMVDVRRQEIRLAVAGADWPYHADLSDLEVTLPEVAPSNVENGFGFVGGVAVWILPFHRCQVIPAPTEAGQDCSIVFSGESASISGRVVRATCGGPHTLAEVRLTEMFTSEEGILRWWKTGWGGEYRFEGVRPGAELTLDLGAGTEEIPLPSLGVGERYVVPDIAVAGEC